jgi:hypothetical protein
MAIKNEKKKTKESKGCGEGSERKEKKEGDQ